ncbi:MAG TPA: NifB/NifX family molybdenum-iron cluster-binding protein [Clostridia bacterium]|nr:NifB/NifX family molybdenum-iron cluster-binding protein [Clostridia bacterium]
MMIVACATNDGENFVSCHFGDAKQYDIYEMDEKGYRLLETVRNTTGEEEEEIHADPRKAKGIVDLLRKKKVQLGMTKVFGPNIKRVARHFVPVIANEDKISQGLKALLEDHKRIERIIEEDKKDTYLDLKNGKEGRIMP